MLVQQNTLMVEEREREIRQIVQSISDLNEIFRDLGAMIVEQVREAPFLIAGVPFSKLWPASRLLWFHAPARKKREPTPAVRVCVSVSTHRHVCTCVQTECRSL